MNILQKIIKLEYFKQDQNKITLINFLFGLQFIMPYLALYIENQLQSLSQVALVFSIQSASMIIFELPSGISSDMLGRKRSLILAGLLQIFSLLTLYFSSNIIGFFLFAIFLGIIIGFSHKASESYIYESLIERKDEKSFKKHFINFHGMWSVGATVSSLLSGFFVYYDLKNLILGSIIVSCMIPYLALHLNGLKKDRVKRFYVKNISKILNRELFTKAITAFVLFNIFYIGIFDESLKLKSILFSEKIVDIQFIGLFTAIFYFLTALGLRASHHISQKYSDYQVFLIGLAGFVTSSTIAMFTSGVISVIIFSLNGFFFSLNRPVISHLLNKNISNEHRATTISVFKLLGNFAQLIIGIWISIASLYLNIIDIYLLMSLLLITLLVLFRRMFVYLK